MARSQLLRTVLLAAAVTMLSALPAAGADFEVRDDQGRRILLKDDGTWRYIDAKDAPAAPAKDAKDTKDTQPPPMADLRLLGRSDSPVGCQFDFMLSNTLPYEIRSLVPEFAVHRANGVIYSTQSIGFTGIKPGDQRQRALRFGGIACAEVSKLQVLGGDRCEMGDLDRFNDTKGLCLGRVRLLPTDVVKFEK